MQITRTLTRSHQKEVFKIVTQQSNPSNVLSITTKDLLEQSEIYFTPTVINVILAEENQMQQVQYQTGVFGQTQMLSVLDGEIFAIIIDRRPGSETQDNATCFYLNAPKQEKKYIKTEWLFVPEGFACGYVFLQNNTRVLVMKNKPDTAKHKRTVNPFLETFCIEWPIKPNKIQTI